MTKPTSKQVAKIKAVLEDTIGSPCITTQVDGDLVSFLFPENIKVPPLITELREDLEDQGFWFFHSIVMYKNVAVKSFNFVKK